MSMVSCQREGNLPSLTIAIILARCQAKHLTNIIKRKDWREPSHSERDPARGEDCIRANGGRPAQGRHWRIGAI